MNFQYLFIVYLAPIIYFEALIYKQKEGFHYAFIYITIINCLFYLHFLSLFYNKKLYLYRD